MPIINFKKLRAKKLDPTKLSPKDALLLGQLLDQEEKRVRTNDQDTKDKIFEPGKVYQVRQGDTIHQIYFTKLLVRRKKENKQIVLLGAGSEFPDPMKKGTLYFKNNSDGSVSVKTINDKEPKTLTPEQSQKFFAEGFTFSEDQTVVITNNNDNYKRFSAVTALCGYNTYLYQIGDRKLGEGAYGEVYDSPGKLEHAKDGKQMVYVSYLSKREEADRAARKGKVIKVQKQPSDETDRERIARQEDFVAENILLRESPETRQYLPTKKGTYQKKGMIGKTREKIGAAVQEKVSGKNLSAVLKEKMSAQDRYELTIAILQAMKEFHGLGKIHRDIKPDNIIVDMSKRPFKAKVIDWGMATDNTKTTFQIVGTTGWMAPEMWVANKYGGDFNAAKADAGNDNFAIGLILRKLWDDSTISEREDLRIGGKSLSEPLIKDVASIEWLLGLSIKKPDLSPKVTNGLQPEQIEKLNTIMDGMTLTDVEKRMSADKALSIIHDDPSLEEKKSADEKPLPQKEMDLRKKRYDRAEREFGSRTNKKIQLLFLSEAMQEVTRLSLSLSAEQKQLLQLDVFKEILTETAKICPEYMRPGLIIKTIELRDRLENVTPENIQQICAENKKVLERLHSHIPAMSESKKIMAIESKGANTLSMMTRLAAENHMDAKSFAKTAQPVIPAAEGKDTNPKAVTTLSVKSAPPAPEAKEENVSMQRRR